MSMIDLRDGAPAPALPPPPDAGDPRRRPTGSALGDRAGVAGLWALYREHRDERSRGALVTTYYPLVKHVARRVAASLPHRIEIGDLEGYGAEGLLEAVDRYDETLGAQFATFAAHRIKGAIYDGIRSTDWAPRSIRRKEREIGANFGWLCTEHGRQPTEAEEASALGVDVGSLRSSKRQIANARVGSLESRLVAEISGDCEPCDPDGEPLAIWLASETRETLRAGIGLLDERQREVTVLSFGAGLTLAEIGERLGVSESRVCQIRSGAIKRLRAYARAQGLAEA